MHNCNIAQFHHFRNLVWRDYARLDDDKIVEAQLPHEKSIATSLNTYRVQCIIAATDDDYYSDDNYSDEDFLILVYLPPKRLGLVHGLQSYLFHFLFCMRNGKTGIEVLYRCRERSQEYRPEQKGVVKIKKWIK